MDVHVPEAGDQILAAAVDDARAGGDLGGDRGTDRDDAGSPHDDGAIATGQGIGAVDHGHVGERDGAGLLGEGSAWK